MENLNNICLICFSYKRDLQHLSSKTDDEVTYLDKLTVAIPEMVSILFLDVLKLTTL